MDSFRRTTSDQLREKLNRGERLLMVDVRNRDEYEHEHIAGSINIPVDTLDIERFLRTHDDTAIYLICNSGKNAYIAASKFFDCGFFEVIVIAGGILSWRVLGYPLVHQTGNK